MKLLLSFLILLLMAGCSLTESIDTSGNNSQIPVEVLSVIDGDTIKILYEGKETTVRYLLIDTPETNHPRIGEQLLGKEATAENRRLLESGDVISIEFDIGDRLDNYGRLLAYVYVDDVSVQQQLLEKGLARVAYVFPPNTRYLDGFKKAEQKAKELSLGIWEYENYATERGFDSQAIKQDENPINDPVSKECNIKGNINTKGDKIYHLPSNSSYEQTNPEEWFCSEQEAKDNGFRGIGQ